MRGIILLLFVSGFAAGCEDNDDKVFKNGGNTEKKPLASLASALQSTTNLDATNAAPTLAATVTYELKVTSNSGAQLCNGDVQLQIMSDFSLKFPEAKAQCVSLTLDLASVLGASGGLKSASGSDPGVTHDGTVLSVKDLANATFNPPRPFLLGPVVQDSSKYVNFSRTVQTHLTAKDGKSGDGSFAISVQDVDTSYQNKFITAPFTKVLHWTMAASGFDGVPATDGLLFKKWEWYFNTRPIMIPKIEIVGALGDLIQDNGSGGTDTANALVGELTIDLVVKSYDMAGASGGTAAAPAAPPAASPAPPASP